MISLVHKYYAVVGDGTNGFSSITATFTTAPTAGNLLIAVFGESGSNNIATPSGWQVAVVYQNASPGGAIFYKIATGSESTVTVTTSGGASTSYGMGLQLYEYNGMVGSPRCRGEPEFGHRHVPDIGKPHDDAGLRPAYVRDGDQCQC